MNRSLSIIILLLFSISSFGQTYSKRDLKYHPKTFEEALTQLDKMFSDSLKVKIKNMSEDDFAGYTHFGLGMWIRNEWLYDRIFFRLIVTQSPLRKELTAKGLPCNDDMSDFILTSYYRRLNNKPIDMEGQIKKTQDYWKASEEHFYKLKTDSTYKKQYEAKLDSLKSRRIEDKKNEWKPGTIISGYLRYQCGFIDLGENTKVKGEIIRWQDDSIILRITKYFDEKKKDKVIKCNDVKEDIVTIEYYGMFSLDK
jgi:hypothetical protein